jgi:CspA family cold shock protein
MGRYKDYREPQRRGRDSNYFSDDRAEGASPNYEGPSEPQTSPSVDAVVKWFNPEKGFGFVAMDGGSEAFIHIRQLEAAGHSGLAEGTRVKVRIGPGQKGPQVTELIEVEATTPPDAKASERSSSDPVTQVQPAAGAMEECVGSVKWYNAAKGFGFIGRDGGGKDVFVHVTTLEASGLSGLTEGQRIRMQIAQGKKGLEARSIKLLA